MHNHSHTPHAPAHYSRAFAIGIALNTVFIIAEILYGIKADSLALLSDAGHNASDVLGLGLAWAATWLAKRQPNHRYTYGLQSSSIMAALANAILLLVAIGGIAWEAVQRLQHPALVAGGTVIAVAAAGIIINGVTALLFKQGHHHDLNIRGAYLHMVADAAVSFGVVIAGLAMMQTGWLWLDPLVSLMIALVIVISTWSLLKDAINLALHAVPAHIEYAEVKAFLAAQSNVKAVHDLHIWAMSTTETALSAHLLMQSGYPHAHFMHDVAHALQERFHIGHTTIQVEVDDCGHGCT